MEGKVKFYNPRKGYGFITGDDGKDYFVHATQLQPEEKLYPEDTVQFESGESDKGLQAQNVVKVGSGDSSAAQTEDTAQDDNSADDAQEEASDAQDEAA